MQPTSYPIRRDVLKQFWHNFMKTGDVGEVPGAAADPVVVRSWQRCSLRADPRQRPRLTALRPASLETAMRAQADLMALARPFLEDIYQLLEGAYCAIVFTDSAGCILDIEGNQTDQSASPDPTRTRGRTFMGDVSIGGMPAPGLAVGTLWSEGNLGTNAIGLALLTAMPVQVAAAEHYYEVYHYLATSAAPIHEVGGRIVGTIALVEPVVSVTRHSLSLVMAAARAITNQLQANLYLEEANHRLSQVNTILETIREGIISWDETGKVNHINAQAATILGCEAPAMLGKPIERVLALPTSIHDAISQREELHDIEVSFETVDAAVRVLASLRHVQAGNGFPAGYIAMLRPIEEVHQLVHRQVGTQASLVLDDISSYSAVMRPVLRQARTAARGMAPVLLSGEGGVGKNHLARVIHNESPRADGPFMAINCRAIPHELMVGELLGYEEEPGRNGRPSKFELASGGTLLLDQVESLSLEMQSALLHAVETRHVMRLGSMRPIPVDVRIIAATTADLEQLVADGNFVPHLYYRFGVFNIAIPPLRERVDDIPLLAERFLSRITNRDAQAVWIDDEAMPVLQRYPWPGNVRELESVLERAVNQSRSNVIAVTDLPESVRHGRVVTRSPRAQPVLSVMEAEREAILKAGWACHGHVTEMARQLGIGRTTLWRKMKRHNISPESFRE